MTKLDVVGRQEFEVPSLPLLSFFYLPTLSPLQISTIPEVSTTGSMECYRVSVDVLQSMSYLLQHRLNTMTSQALDCVLQVKRWLKQDLCLLWDHILAQEDSNRQNRSIILYSEKSKVSGCVSSEAQGPTVRLPLDWPFPGSPLLTWLCSNSKLFMVLWTKHTIS